MPCGCFADFIDKVGIAGGVFIIQRQNNVWFLASPVCTVSCSCQFAGVSLLSIR